MSRFTIPGVVVLIIGAGAITAPAQVESEFADYGSAADPIVIGGGGFPVMLTFPKFDTSLGTLTNILITLASTNSAQATVANIGSAMTFANAQAFATAMMTDLEGTNLAATLETIPFSGSIGSGTPASPTYVFGTALQGPATATLNVNSANFGLYEWAGVGPNNFTLEVDATAQGSGSGGSALFFGSTANAYGSAQINYYYSGATPEPDAASLAALAIGALAVRRKLRPRAA